MSRYLVIGPDGSTIEATLSMELESALLNILPGQTLVAIDPATDNGGIINNTRIAYDNTSGLLLDTETSLPPVGLDDVVLGVVD